jgi:sugar lactone lactonase YvrE
MQGMKSGRSGKLILALAAVQAVPASAATAVYATSPPAFHIDVKTSGNLLTPLLSPVNPWGLACDPETGRIYFSDPTGGQIGSIDPAVPAPAVTHLIQRPAAAFHGIAIDSPNRRLFYLDSANDSVNVIRLDTLAEETIVTGRGIARPNDLVWDPSRGWIFFTDSGADFIGVIRSWGAGGALDIQGFPVTDPWGIAVHPQDGTLYYTSYSGGTLHTLNPVTGVTALVTSGLNGPRGLRFDAYGRLFCLESGLNRVRQLPLAGQAVSAPDYHDAENGRAFLIFETDDLDGDHLADAWERRFRPTLAGLSAASDPDQDGRSALDELLFNGSPATGADAAAVRGITVSGGTLTATFQGPRDGYGFSTLLSSDLAAWQTFGASLTKENLADPLFATWTLTLANPAALGLDPARVFVRFQGTRTTP